MPSDFAVNGKSIIFLEKLHGFFGKACVVAVDILCAEIVKLIQSLLNIFNIRPVHGVAERIADCVIAHQRIPRDRSEIAVRNKRILLLEPANRHLSIGSVDAVGLRCEITEFLKPVLIEQDVVARIADVKRFRNAFRVIKSFFCVSSDFSVNGKIVCCLEFLYAGFHRFIKPAVLRIDIAEFVKPLLDSNNILTRIADHAEVCLCIIRHKQSVCCGIKSARDLKFVPALEYAQCIFCYISEIIRGFILIHVPKDHEPLLNIGNHIVVFSCFRNVLCFVNGTH